MIRRAAPALLLLAACGAPPSAPSAPPPEFACRRASGPVTVDGRADEPAWARAAPIESFAPHWLGRPARSKTRARLLWDDEALYFFAEMEDADLYADIVERDGMAWLNDVFELFFKPSDRALGYYEFQVNAAGAILDMYLPSRGSGGYARWARAHPFGTGAAVTLRGTLNRAEDDDQGWSAEGRLPWRDFSPTGGRPKAGDVWRFALCRYDYSKAFEQQDLSSCAPLTRPDFHRYEDYARLRFAGD